MRLLEKLKYHVSILGGVMEGNQNTQINVTVVINSKKAKTKHPGVNGMYDI
jgi:hypothetical protein